MSTIGKTAGSRAKTGEPRRFLEETVLGFSGDECLDWPFSCNSAGYPNISNSARGSTLVTRIVCAHRHGPAPTPKHEAAHNCGNHQCVNGAHLRWATHVENEHDKAEHGTKQSGEKHCHAKLTSAQVLEIRALRGIEKQTSIAERMGVSKGTVGDIQRGRGWRSVAPLTHSLSMT